MRPRGDGRSAAGRQGLRSDALNVGFHFQVPSVFVGDDRVRVPAFYGMFIDELARQAGRVTYYTYEASGSTAPTGLEDYDLIAPSVRCVNLGPRPPAPSVLHFPRRLLSRIDLRRDEIDVLLVRGPGPLLPPLLHHARDVPAAALIMGDYRSWQSNAANAAWRNQLIRLHLAIYRRLQRRALQGNLVLVNNPALLRGEKHAEIREVFTSSLTQAWLDQPERIEPRTGRVRLLSTGRIVEEKGVLLLVEALADLIRRGIDATLELVGWTPPGDPTPNRLMELARQLRVDDRVTLTPPSPAGGPELLARYLAADVFVFASPTEWGAPHTVLEAMGARLPVVTSSIEGLRGSLIDGEHAVLVDPASASALAEGVERVVRDGELRQRLMTNGRRWAEHRTNENSVAQIVEHLKAWVHP